MAVFGLATLALAAATPIAGPPASSMQQRFDAASEAAAKHNCALAISLFEELEPQMTLGSLAAATSAVRKGICLVRMGRLEAGEATILAGLPQVVKAGSQFAGDVAEAETLLGYAALMRWNYQGAAEHAHSAAAMQNGANKILALSLAAKATAFDGGITSLGYIDEALRAAPTGTSASKDLLAHLHGLRGRTLLNQGRNAEAYAELKMALDLSGGLTLQASLSEISIRGDLALAAFLLNKKDDARMYLAYTGQGRLEKAPFSVAESMAAPDCGAVSGLRPEDFAVVEFDIADDGSVSNSQTIYSRGGREVAAAFARAVADWYWAPAAVKDISPFYRAASRVELRCSAASGASTNIEGELTQRFTHWAEQQTHIQGGDENRRKVELDALSRIIAVTKLAGPFEQYAAAVSLRAFLDPRYSANRAISFDELLRAPEASHLSREVHNTMRYFQKVAVRTSRLKQKQRLSDADRLAIANEFWVFAAEPAVAEDALLAATAKMNAASILRKKQIPEQRTEALRQVVDDARLGSGSRLRQYALLQFANDAAASGDLASAQSYFQKTGLTEEQCALLGPKPEMRSDGTASGFPSEAMAYGFEGWVRLEFDIAADGSPKGSRAVIAYPPFVFDDSATKMSQAARFRSTFRPGGSVACAAKEAIYRFVRRP